ncbi:diguanylate cyclase (GGDEF)-like protein [Bacillus mesophilus]|uniref:Sensor domain-containing phosphodiesterase n=1 Tax=Bacillus mesophilus TaxID=1808955 RepID=A0A6M0Q7G0_9BACI|nr:GGDEF domain-containing protein [Bacillus mesophilus]MBM7661554.1 diguanylate cyclase (GGDEF)-like protein [Bacillus mesophilus]NEY72223.1 sensor domain-containing phosphodiesterase [Bacillus mesophilus]
MKRGREPLFIPELSEINNTDFQDIISSLGGDGCYFGVPLFTKENQVIGTLCGIDTRPYSFSQQDIHYINSIAHLITQTIILERLLIKDDLTGLYNRQFAQSYLENDQNPKHEIFSLLYMDVDRFKLINDSYGHETGDQLVLKIAERITEMLHQNGIACRMGGDEFLVIIPKNDHKSIDDYLHEVESFAEELSDAISQPILVNGEELQVHVSIGISIYPLHAKDMETLLKNADMAMYKAKEKGSKIEVYDRRQGKTLARQLLLENEMRKALERDEFTLHYQSQYDIQTGNIVGLEALIRWEHPIYGSISPGEFIPIAEETGFIIQIGEWVIKQVCQDGQSWLEQGGQPIQFSLNISSEQIKSKRFVERVEKIITETGFDPCWLKFEITESIFMENLDIAVKVITQLKGTGLWTALDDFGTGYSSLSYIKHLPIDYLKIDRGFIKEITNNNGDQAIVKAMITLCNELGIGVIAEGIEDMSQHQYLKKHGCHIGQGFYYQRPVPFQTLVEMNKLSI